VWTLKRLLPRVWSDVAVDSGLLCRGVVTLGAVVEDHVDKLCRRRWAACHSRLHGVDWRCPECKCCWQNRSLNPLGEEGPRYDVTHTEWTP
jgi:lipopolysaccharide biosynthesis regulator YciM